MPLIDTAARSIRALTSSRIVTPRLDHVARKLLAVRAYGAVPAAGLVAAAQSFPHRPYVIDDEGTLTFTEVDRRTNQIAAALLAAGIREGDGVGLMCRNGRAFVEGMLACSKIGATVLLLNTDFAGPQLRDVLEREDAKGLIADAEFDRLLPAGVLEGRRWVGFRAADDAAAAPTLASLVRASERAPRPAPPARVGRIVILTSGTTGTPKGAARDGAPLSAVIGILDRLPFAAGQVHYIAAPMFHGWGLLNFSLGLVLPTTLVLRRRFDPEEALRVIDRYGVDSAAMVPTMLERMLRLPDDVRARYDTRSLSAIPMSGSTLPGELAREAIEAFGRVPYNFYGSTETGWASIATPDDLWESPGTAGTPPLGNGLLLLDDAGAEVPRGEQGTIYVRSPLRMARYTDPGLSKPEHAGHMSTGDVGHLDAQGRLFVDGRDDDMIVSGGENVFPREVEDLLSAHAEVVEAAVVGVPDAQFGQALAAFVVLAAGATLDDAALREHVRANLARYKVPRSVAFLNALPRNPSGKVLKRELLSTLP